MTFEIYRRRLSRQPWRWRLRADNGEIIASGEGYRDRNKCVHAVRLIQERAASSQVEVFP